MVRDRADALLKKAGAGELPDELARQAEIRFNARTGRGELNSWRNSLPVFLADLCEAGLEHVEVLLEHRLPLSPKRVDVVKLQRGESLAGFVRDYPSSVPPQTVALVNNLDNNDSLAAGELYKRITGGR